MRPLILILACLVAWVTPVVADTTGSLALESASQTQLVSFAPGVAAPKTFSPIIKVQGRACSACRRACVADWKIDCYDSDRYCRRQFVRCMRICWEDYCR
jgi:hypothetical protein